MKCSMKNEDADIDNNVDIRDCTFVTKTKHKNLIEMKKSLSANLGCNNITIECSGSSLSYLYLAFILLILF